MNLNDLTILRAIAEKGSFVSAATHLDLPTSTLSRRLASLEKELDVKLVQRTSRTVTLTEQGRLLYQQVAPHLQGILDGVSFLKEQEQELSGKLTVISPIFVSYLCLSDWIAEFQSLHPNLDVNYRISNTMEDILAENVDLAIRPGPLKDSSLIARKLYDTSMNIYASSSWQKTNKLPRKPQDLNQADAFTLPYLAKPWNLYKSGKEFQLTTNYRIYANDFGPLAQGIIHNPVIGVLPTLYGDEFVRKGKLIKLLSSYRLETPGPIYGVYPSKQFMPKKTQALLEFITHKFEQLSQGNLMS